MDFAISEEASHITDSIDRFIETEVEPLERENPEFLGEDYEKYIVDENHRQVDAYRDVLNTIRQKSAEAGFYGMSMPSSIGGGDVDVLTRAVVGENVANREPGFQTPILGGAGGPTKILLACDEDQTRRFVDPLMAGELTTCFALSEPDHGSDPQYMDTTATRDEDGWVINGEKYWISNGPYADFAMVFARTSGQDGDSKGITCFIIDADNPGYSVGKIHRTMGLTPGGHSELHFEECRVSDDHVLGEVDEGFTTAMQWINSGRLYLAAHAIGKAQFLLDRAVEYAADRETFERPIGDRQGISFELVDVATEIEQTRHLYRYAAWAVEDGQSVRKEVSMAKLRAAEALNRAADVAVQVFGAAGFMKSNPVERMYRAARVFRIFEGTDEIQRQTIANELLKP
jgi:alkylation response protein AidB-like acyl-CoA dehydrogenase